MYHFLTRALRFHANASVLWDCDVTALLEDSNTESSFVAERVERIEAIVEKPKPDAAPSTLGVVGRYILTPRIFHYLATVAPGSGGEIQLTDGIAALLDEERVLAYRYRGKRFDCGSKLGYLQATVDFGRRHPEVGAAFTNYLTNLE